MLKILFKMKSKPLILITNDDGITAPGIKDAENLTNIKKELKKRGYTKPLIADIHYQPKAAEIAARIVEKVRINPGNYVDRKRGRLQFTESEYNAELEKIRERIKPLINICKKMELQCGSDLIMVHYPKEFY